MPVELGVGAAPSDEPQQVGPGVAEHAPFPEVGPQGRDLRAEHPGEQRGRREEQHRHRRQRRTAFPARPGATSRPFHRLAAPAISTTPADHHPERTPVHGEARRAPPPTTPATAFSRPVVNRNRAAALAGVRQQAARAARPEVVEEPGAEHQRRPRHQRPGRRPELGRPRTRRPIAGDACAPAPRPAKTAIPSVAGTGRPRWFVTEPPPEPRRHRDDRADGDAEPHDRQHRQPRAVRSPPPHRPRHERPEDVARPAAPRCRNPAASRPVNR